MRKISLEGVHVNPNYVFLQEAEELATLLTAKHQQYGESYKRSGDILKLLYPNGINPEQYGDMLAVTRIVDKLFRIAVGLSDDVENWRDVAGYGLIMKMRAGEVKGCGGEKV